MLGRKVYDEGISSLESGNTHVVSGLGLKPGMYYVKAMGNNSFGTAKVVIQ